jgi:hypothetical protein
VEDSIIEGVKAAGVGAAGAAVGAGTYAVIGGVGVVAAGEVGITLGPFIAIGAGIGLAGYGIYWLGKQIGRTSHLSECEPPRGREE